MYLIRINVYYKTGKTLELNSKHNNVKATLFFVLTSNMIEKGKIVVGKWFLFSNFEQTCIFLDFDFFSTI